MEKNYYDILQVNKNASPEIIDKAYKVLAKKYHPDLQSAENKKDSEELLKQINEAYSVLSDPIKKEKYDKTLSYDNINNNNSTTINNNTTNNNLNNQNLRDELIKKQQEIELQRQLQKQIEHQKELEYEQELLNQIENAKQKAYHDAYIQDLKNRGYRIKYKKSLEDYIKNFISIIITAIILFLLWKIPFIHNYFLNLFEENEILSSIIDVFSNK